jgi:hypothetical protein
MNKEENNNFYWRIGRPIIGLLSLIGIAGYFALTSPKESEFEKEQ